MVNSCLIGPDLTMAERARLTSQPDDHRATDRHEQVDSISEYDRNRLRGWNQDIPTLVNSLVHGQIEAQA